MKTGTVAKRFGVDPNTIADWTERFTEFFSPEARSENRKQRDYQPDDLIVLNTIRGYRAKNTDWNEIRGLLAAGERDANLPPDFVSIDGENAITVYAEMREMRVKLETAEAEIERLYQVIEDERKQTEEKFLTERNRSDEQMRSEREDYQARIEKLIEEKTEWRMMYQNLKKQLEEAEDDE